MAKKRPSHTQNIDLVSERKHGLVKYSVFDFGKFDFENMSYDWHMVFELSICVICMIIIIDN